MIIWLRKILGWALVGWLEGVDGGKGKGEVPAPGGVLHD